MRTITRKAISALNLMIPLKQRFATMAAHWNHLESFKNHNALFPPPEILISFIGSAAWPTPRDCHVQPRLESTASRNIISLLPPSSDSQMEAKPFTSSHGALVLFSMILEVK